MFCKPDNSKALSTDLVMPNYEAWKGVVTETTDCIDQFNRMFPNLSTDQSRGIVKQIRRHIKEVDFDPPDNKSQSMATPITDPCIFIVDDDEAVLDSLSLLLRVKGKKSRGFASAEAFLEFWRPEHRGCLLLDWRMEGMEGPTLQQALAKRGSRLPVLFITAYGDTAKARLAYKAGAVSFLEKPLDDRILFATIQEAMKRNAESNNLATATIKRDKVRG
ncbi:hypothetical protein CCP4SC76_2000002 [Gammaproteobacteria bacterium]